MADTTMKCPFCGKGFSGEHRCEDNDMDKYYANMTLRTCMPGNGPEMREMDEKYNLTDMVTAHIEEEKEDDD